MNIPYSTAWRISLISILMLIVVRMAPPFSWAQTQFLFSYDAGFQRRALLGEILAWIFPQGMTQQNTYVVAAAITISAVLVLTAYIARSFSLLANGGALLILFSFSVGLGTFVGNTGNLDGVVLVLAICALVIPKRSVGYVGLASIICAIGAFFHENMLPYFALLVSLDVWLQGERNETFQRLILSATPLVVTTIAVAILFAYGTHSPEQVEGILHTLETRSLDFDIRATTLEPVTAFPEGEVGRLGGVWATDFFRFRLLAFGGVGLLFLMAFVWLIMRAIAHRHIFDQVLVLMVIISPMSLLLVAFDVSRFVAIAFLNVFLVIAIMSRLDRAFRERLPDVMTPVVIVALMVFQSHIALRDLNSRQNFQARFPGAVISQGFWFNPE